MSGLERFEKDASCRKNILNLLVVERRRPTPPRELEKYLPVSVVEDFRQMAEQRNVETRGAIEFCEDTILHAPPDNSVDLGDESFETLERMCDKTASDPNSSLFNYLHSDKKEAIVAQVGIEEAYADGSLVHKDAVVRSAELTQIEDVEAPSRFWDNTILDVDGIQTSPVKLVGLLRPSTILEGTEDGSLSRSSIPTESCSSNYETANGTCSSFTAEGSTVNVERKNYTTCQADIAIGDDIQVDYFEGNNSASVRGGLSILSDFEQKCYLSDKEEDESIIEISDDEEASENSNKLLINESIPFIEDDDNKENESLQFDNTMDEVDYILRKGAEMMKSVDPSNSNNNLDIDDNGHNPSPLNTKAKIHMDDKRQESPSSFRKPSLDSGSSLRSNTTNKNVHANRQEAVDPTTSFEKKMTYRFEFEKKPNPRENFFKHPTTAGLASASRLKELRQPFSHIVSPVRTYRQKTGITPLMVTVKNKPQLQSKQFNSHNIDELDYEASVLNKSHSVINSKRISGIPLTATKLPKRAYISSEYKHITDERTKVTIPGGSKIQKYLKTATAPKVMRHDGKMHLPNEKPDCNSKTSKIPRPNQSLADLSLMSGDVSMYTLKDAQKF